MSDAGRLVAGRYRVVRRVGSGAMGVVWECVDEVLDRTVAVKQLVLPPGLDEDGVVEVRARAMREGRIAARLQHQHAIAVFDVADDAGRPVLVMEFLASRSLAAVLGERGRLEPREVARIGMQVAGALGAAHAAGVVHRDVKPGNILLGDDGEVKITDFGISRATGDVQVTKTGMLAGTPAFLSPDVAQGEEPTPASDVFSLGATLYTAVEGRPPFGLNDNALAMLHVVAAGRIEPPVEAGPLTRPLMEMLRSKVEDRPAMAAVREMLADVAEGRTLTSVPTPIPVPAVTATEGDVSGSPGAEPTAVVAASKAREAEAGPRNWRPLGVSLLAQVATAVVGLIVTAAFLSSQNLGDNQPNQDGPRSAAPPPPAQSSPVQPGPPPPSATSDSLPIAPPTLDGPALTTTDVPTTTTGAGPAPGEGPGPSKGTGPTTTPAPPSGPVSSSEPPTSITSPTSPPSGQLGH